MNNGRHHRSGDDPTPHRRHSSQRHPSPRVDFAQHQHPPPPLKQLQTTDSRALRSALIESCKTFKALLLRMYNDGHSPDRSSSYKKASGDVKAYYRRLSEPECKEERTRENTQMAMLWAKQLFQMDALLQKQWKEKQRLHDRYSDYDQKRKA